MRRAKEDAPTTLSEGANPIDDDSTSRPPAAVAGSAPRCFELYVGDLFAAGKGLVRANYELWALQQYGADPEIAAAVAEMAVATSELVALLKWVQNRLRGIDWEARPELGHGVVTEPVALTAVGGRP